MIIIDYDSNPKNSIFYTSAALYNYLKTTSNKINLAKQYFLNVINRNYLLFQYSIDWLYLIGKIKEVKDGNIICD